MPLSDIIYGKVSSIAILWPLGNKSTIFSTAAFGVILYVFLCARGSTKNDPAKLRMNYIASMLSLSAAMVIIFHEEKFSLYAINALAAAGLVLAINLIKPIHTRIPLYVTFGVLGWRWL